MNWFMRGGSHMARQARRRRRRFDSLAAAKASYRGRGAFKSWREPFLDDYLHDGIDRVDDNTADSEDAAWELLCDPKWEAATFAAQRNRPWAALSRVRRRKIPVTILRAEHGSVLSDRVTDKLTRKLPAMVLKRKRGSSHFLPMEAPYEVRDLLSSYISRLVEGFSASEEGPVQRSLSSGERWTGN
jgi:pimeloyl-ACP methyl ester carboxylesterase